MIRLCVAVVAAYQNWLSCDSVYSVFSPSIVWSALLVALFHIISPDVVASVTAPKIDEKTYKTVRGCC